MEIVTLALVVVAVVMLGMLLRRSQGDAGGAALAPKLEVIERLQERGERTLKDEFGLSRQAADEQSRGLRAELGATLAQSREAVERRLTDNAAQLQQQLDAFGRRL